ncbi:hypothetical protein DW121_15345 [Bacteroides sp. AM10-21B]|nr:hypothetical protein [Bacteroides propionicigenes]RGM27806.1 hypothetical protein DXC20_10350 [Bacteroides sp. OM08-17BH]RHJ47607.1 hypothetical protein DW121_15345 [Bacteroides sp. AM10-21B]HBO06474.1 hypothetical protein [Bacteroides sp.]
MPMKVSEPAVAYNTPYLQGLKNRLIASIDSTTDEGKLQECLELLHEDTMPCCFTEEELDEEIRLSEASGFATDEEVAAMFAKWKI